MKKIYGIASFAKKNTKEINQLLRFPLRRVREKIGNTIYRFEGINERINLIISESEADIWYTFTEEKQDWLYDLSLTASINSEGKYFCSECQVPVYQSEADLYYAHFIKQLSSLIRRKFTKDIFLVYYCTKSRGIYFTKLVKRSELSMALKRTIFVDGFHIISIEKVIIK